MRLPTTFLLLAVLLVMPAWLGPAWSQDDMAGAVEATGLDVSSERALPEACVTFDRPLARPSDVLLRSFVEVAPKGDHALSVRNDRLCVSGLEHGATYRILVRAGLAAQDGSTLAGSASFEAAVPDRAPAVSFRGQGDVLPLSGDPVLPVTSVNVDEIRLELFQVTDRSLVERIAQNAIGWQQSGWDIRQLQDQTGRRLFAGKVRVEAERNREVTTAVPLAGLLGPREPGIYVAVARPADDAQPPWQSLPTRWFALTDTGLFTWQGEDGLLVHAASLTDGRPLAGRELVLMARANRQIATVVTGPDGFAQIPAGELRGEGGDAPQALFAYGPAGDFIWLDLERSGLDLADRGVDGRTPPGALDAFLWTERGVYRPGETVHLGLLLRDRQAEAVADQPLVLVVSRPDQVEVDRKQVTPAAAGGALVELELAASAYPGTWTVTAHVGDGTAPIGRVSFAVDDIVPPRLEVKLDGPDRLAPGARATVRVQADYLFGAPAGDLPVEAELLVRPAEQPFSAWKGWRFGPEELPFLPTRRVLPPGRTDATGGAAFDITVEEPGAGQPLQAVLSARVSDVDGRPVGSEHVLAIAEAAGHVAILPEFSGGLPENGIARFRFGALDDQGRARSNVALDWQLFAEEVDYLWVQQGGAWNVETVVTDRPMDSGSLRSGADGTVGWTHPVASGRFRVELAEPGTGNLASVRFTAGWWSATDEEERPDQVEISQAGSDGPSGDLSLFVRPPYRARVIVMLADSRIRTRVEAELGPEGGLVRLPATAIEPGGLYVLATALAAPGAAHPRLPARAVGVLHLPGPKAERTLEVALDVPATSRPGSDLPVAVTVQGLAEGEKAYVALAAVDDAVLQITGQQPPDPVGYFLGQRRLGLELRDVYGRLIDPEGARGRIVTGGDARMALQFTGNQVRSYEIVSLAQGPVEIGEGGQRTVRFDLPDFDGRLDVTAVVWSRDRLGRAQAKAVVRGPVVAELTRPRFLGTGDEATLLLDVHLGEGPAGQWAVDLTSEGPLTLSPSQPAPLQVRPGASVRRTVHAKAGDLPGTARMRMTLTGPDGAVVERRFAIEVRSPRPHQAERTIGDLTPGQELVIDAALGGQFQPGTAEVAVTLGPLPELGLARLVDSLMAYPYGCVEQTVSKAGPLLAARRLRPALGLGPEPAEASVGLQDAVRRLVDLQSAGGAFGLWSPTSPVETWLSAYVGDFLLRAQEQHVHVPVRPLDKLAGQLAIAFSSDDTTPAGLQGRAYAAYVLARMGRLDVATLRWFEGRYLAALPSDLARAQVAAALALSGDRPSAERAVAALNGTRVADEPLADYGSDLRDAAGSLALLVENDLIGTEERDRRLVEIAAAYGDPGNLDTQSQAWLLRAGTSLLPHGGVPVQIELDGVRRPPDGRPLQLARPLSPDMTPIRLGNAGSETLYRTIIASGLPLEAQPPAQEGFFLKRTVLRMDGQVVSGQPERPGTTKTTLRQGERVVILLEGRVRQPGERDILLVDLLPAGLEIEPVQLDGGAQRQGELAWLGDLTPPLTTVSRDDRFAAALAGYAERFRLAYVARATTPGRFVWPASRVEDMYDPASFARTAEGRLEVIRE
ncbi:alpha-2-macroglobulin family protein [Geminicoccus roseus]|uniref:alpha-2-macroglobulin family protein n=1 Tax=Geminicoccus roseus TaxID=404900 RepID=UPI0003F86DC3|nr:alpha-2-macroglobulin [Geminicoccus roseus]